MEHVQSHVVSVPFDVAFMFECDATRRDTETDVASRRIHVAFWTFDVIIVKKRELDATRRLFWGLLTLHASVWDSFFLSRTRQSTFELAIRTLNNHSCTTLTIIEIFLFLGEISVCEPFFSQEQWGELRFHFHGNSSFFFNKSYNAIPLKINALPII